MDYTKIRHMDIIQQFADKTEDFLDDLDNFLYQLEKKGLQVQYH